MRRAHAIPLSCALVLAACDGTEPRDVMDPPGTQIVFAAPPDAGSSFETYVVNADGSGQTRLTDYPEADFSASWSADGRQIYFLSFNRDGKGFYDLYVMNADGADVHLVKTGVSGRYAVAPHGTRIALPARGTTDGDSVPQDDLS